MELGRNWQMESNIEFIKKLHIDIEAFTRGADEPANRSDDYNSDTNNNLSKLLRQRYIELFGQQLM